MACPIWGFALDSSPRKAAYILDAIATLENGMARVFITGSSDGLGLMAGRFLADQAHRIVLHARNDARAADARKAAPKAEAVVVGDLGTIAATKDVAAEVNALGRDRRLAPRSPGRAFSYSGRKRILPKAGNASGGDAGE